MKRNFFAAVSALLFCETWLLNANGAYTPPSVDYPVDNESFSSTELGFISFAVETFGLVAFKNVPGFDQVRYECLQAVAQCYSEGRLDAEAILEVTLPDGTKRVTLATSGLDTFGDYGCPQLGEKLKRMQNIISSTSVKFAQALDMSILKAEQKQKPLLMALNNPIISSYSNFESIVRAGNHLDHLHLYEKREQSMHGPMADDALEKHTDNGLFVALVPAMSFKDGLMVHVEDGFEAELPAPVGLTKILFPNNGNSIIFMVGDGTKNFLGLKSLRAVPHRLTMNFGESARVWFGRMFFPPVDAYMQKQKTTFDMVRLKSIEAGSKRDLAFAGCSSQNTVLRDLTAQACPAGQIYCWMACRSVTGLSCDGNQTVQCVDSNTGLLWTDESSHCFSCGPQCYAGAEMSPPVTPPSQGFCNTNLYPTNMYMDGFNGVSADIPCLVFLFQSWVMDTQVKYAFGSIGAFLVGVFIEFLIWLRRELMREKKARYSKILRRFPDQTSARTRTLLLLSLYGTQLVFAYFAMLLAMSFAAVIFSMIMLGFIAGHFAFNFERPAASNEACCAANESVEGQPVIDGESRNDVKALYSPKESSSMPIESA